MPPRPLFVLLIHPASFIYLERVQFYEILSKKTVRSYLKYDYQIHLSNWHIKYTNRDHMGRRNPVFYSSKSHSRKSQVLHLWMKQFSSFATILAGNLLSGLLPLVISVSTRLTDWSFFVRKKRDIAHWGVWAYDIIYCIYFHCADIRCQNGMQFIYIFM